MLSNRPYAFLPGGMQTECIFPIDISLGVALIRRRTAMSKRWTLVLAFTITACLMSASQLIAAPPGPIPVTRIAMSFGELPASFRLHRHPGRQTPLRRLLQRLPARFHLRLAFAGQIIHVRAGRHCDPGWLHQERRRSGHQLSPGTERTRRVRTITIKNLLTMGSGIRYRLHDLPWDEEPIAYFYPHLTKLLLSDLTIVEPPGKAITTTTTTPSCLA